jgi:hypothetical protein
MRAGSYHYFLPPAKSLGEEIHIFCLQNAKKKKKKKKKVELDTILRSP